jgi:DNA polymerase III epsilon subunit-like protein
MLNIQTIEEYESELNESRFTGFTIKDYLDEISSYKGRNFVFIDTETSGLDRSNDQVTQIAAIVTNDKFNSLDQFELSFKLDKDIFDKKDPERKQFVLSLQRYGGKEKYVDEKEGLDEFVSWLKRWRKPLLVAQNASFDLHFIGKRSGHRLNYNVIDTKVAIQYFFLPALMILNEQENPLAQKIIKNLEVSKRSGLPTSSLGKVVKAVGLSPIGWHDAMADVKMTIDLFDFILNFLKQNQDVEIRKYKEKFISRERYFKLKSKGKI